MLDFEVQRCTRQCAASQRELEPGEEFYSVLIEQDGEVIRQDYSAQAWTGPPEVAIGWWKSRMPDPQANRLNWAPGDVMLHLLEQWAQQPHMADARYVLTLLMIRRRVVRLEESEVDENGNERLVVSIPGKDAELKIPACEPTENRVKEIQDELTRLLFAEAQ